VDNEIFMKSEPVDFLLQESPTRDDTLIYNKFIFSGNCMIQKKKKEFSWGKTQ